MRRPRTELQVCCWGSLAETLGRAERVRSAMAQDSPVGLIGGGPFGWEPGEWTDDTSMAIPILDAVENARSSTTGELLDHLDRRGGARGPSGPRGRRGRRSAARHGPSWPVPLVTGPMTAESLRAAAAGSRLRCDGSRGGNGSSDAYGSGRVSPNLGRPASSRPSPRRKISDLTHPRPRRG